jgi:hypothetical protein
MVGFTIETEFLPLKTQFQDKTSNPLSRENKNALVPYCWDESVIKRQTLAVPPALPIPAIKQG